KQGRHIEVEFVSNVYMVGLEHVIQCNIRDVSERKQLEHLKDDFLSTVSHEIRTPLSNLKMGVDNLEEICAGKQEKNVSEIIDVLKRNADRLVRLINDLLDLSRFESGKIGPFLQNIQISSLVEEVIQGSMSLAKERGLTLKGEYEKDLPGLMADRDLLVRVLTNLLDNALRFAKSEIIVKARKFGLHLQVSVFNDGVGIKPEYIPALFNKFIQINRPLGGNGYKGTGLGLAICNGIIKLHEGKIWAESLGGQGTQFNFSIPLKASRAHE
ncbi:MAG: HAMP domain-containing sensor histidine kinase, partial [Deltaproteobacteria bacterium]|nr:HAMP domain-containing sensor histidine kinase [Deltaproteobacteria bacterium]